MLIGELFFYSRADFFSMTWVFRCVRSVNELSDVGLYISHGMLLDDGCMLV